MRNPGPVKRQSFRHEKGARPPSSASVSESEMEMETLSSES
jgi:hypothetical protein